MKKVLLAITAFSMSATGAVAAPTKNSAAQWEIANSVDDFDDSTTFVSLLSSNDGNAVLAVRAHQDKLKDVSVILIQREVSHLCGQTGSYGNESGYSNLELRIDGGDVYKMKGNISSNNKSIFFKDTRYNLTRLEMVKLLSTAKKVVLRFTDNCHNKGTSWIFAKWSNITGDHNLQKFLKD
jgi:hypothetical protein